MKMRHEKVPLGILMMLILLLAACASVVPMPAAEDGLTEDGTMMPAENITRETGATVTVQDLGDIVVHSYLAPEQFFANNTHIIETANSLVLIDTQFLLPMALDFRAYADSLDKPIERMVITHEHPDHFLGSEAFADVDIYALAEVAAKVEEIGQAEVDEKQAQFGDAIASTYVVPMVLEPGSVEIDGVTFEFELVTNAEAEFQLVTKLPDHGVVSVGDIVYSGLHLILAGSPPTWTEALENLKAEGDMYPFVLPGHGATTDPSVYDANIAWLAKASELMGTATSGEEFKAGLIDAFPDLGLQDAIDFALPFLFPAEDADAGSSDQGGESDAGEGESGAVDMGLGFQLVEVVEDLYSFGNGGAYGAFLVTDEGVIVMDTLNATTAAMMMDAIRSVTDQPIAYLIYSHNHWDHISGGQIFQDAGATVLAHEDITDWLVNHPAPNPAVVLPDESWSGARFDLQLGGKTVELHHFGPSHGEGMTVFRFPETQAIFTVDIVVPKRVGFSYMPDFTPRGWIATLAEIETLEFETVLFAHNAASGPRSSVTEQKQFLIDLQEHIGTRMQAGENPMQVVGTIDLPQYKEWAGYDAWISLNAQRILMEMMMGQ